MTPNRQFSLAQEVLSHLNLGPNSTSPDHPQPVPAAPAMDQILAQIGPLPRQALFLGMASDGLPVMLNLYDPHPGPMLILGDAGAGKTTFLQSLARSLILTHEESDVQFGVITSHLEEWEKVGDTGHRVGVFDVAQTGAQEFILSLASWAHANKDSHQSILILVDDLEPLAKLEMEALQYFRWLLLRGPARRVWPIITVNAERYGQVLAWIEIFRARIFGRVADPRNARALGADPASALDQLAAGSQFTLRENGKWLRFWLPSF